jgi:hypothetical protein
MGDTFSAEDVESPLSAFIYALIASSTVTLPRMETIIAFVEALDDEKKQALFQNPAIAWYCRDFAARLLAPIYTDGPPAKPAN